MATHDSTDSDNVRVAFDPIEITSSIFDIQAVSRALQSLLAEEESRFDCHLRLAQIIDARCDALADRVEATDFEKQNTSQSGTGLDGISELGGELSFLKSFVDMACSRACNGSDGELVALLDAAQKRAQRALVLADQVGNNN